ncbi:MAG: excinuclease ABC subunit A [Deltaproteobacteria bacterium CG11_big_fil_rev_8_21_14_0_20_47_16]|nr:MAG: excinuclease ABC subunit A [Deltaproteobacteria bacterium CG11_big_fil_rev_8_21_14_0_20_47_16]
MDHKKLIIKGAREHNLKDIDVTIPKDKLVVITGLSGSGKSTLAFDTIYAEGQRRYVESLSSYARQFLDQMDKPDVDSIEGLSPAISIEQKTTSHNPRSTVGTVTEIYDYYRLLFARIGVPYCYKCGKHIQSQTVSQMVDHIMQLPEGSKCTIFAPIVRSRKGEYSKELKLLSKQGFVRVRVDGVMHELTDTITIDKKKKHDIDLVVDRIVIKKQPDNRMADSIETALKHADGLAKVEIQGQDEPMLFSSKSACPDCGISYPEITPQLFSFNNPVGACPECTGLGTMMVFDPDLIIPNKNLSLREGAIASWQTVNHLYYQQIAESLAKHYGFDFYTPWKDINPIYQEIFLHGSGDEEIKFNIERHGRKETYTQAFIGVIPQLERRWKEASKDWQREDLERFMDRRECPECHGTRLKKESSHIKVGGISIGDLTCMSVVKSLDFVKALKLSKKDKTIADRILKEITQRLGFLANVGLGYLTLDRTAGTLSGGEAQRIRLASQIGSSLTGVLYVLDEPSIGLHQRDNHKLLETLRHLRDLGNTVIVVEHDTDTIMAADHVIDMGPGAGVHGGKVIAEGTPKQILAAKKSLTGAYISGRKKIPVPKTRRQPQDRWLTVKNAYEHNLKHIDAKIPLGCFVAVTGVSGSGKSTLINETLANGLRQRIDRTKIQAGRMDDIDGVKYVDKLVIIDQSPIGRTPRSNPATYTGVFTSIRDLFAELNESKARGYTPGRFSFNVRGGRCEACEGDGIIKIEMHFLPDVYVECEVCEGKRFNRETLEVLYKGKNISDILNMTIEQALAFFEHHPHIHNKLKLLDQVGLDYIAVGQSATTLSGGEAQRIKLAKELAKRPTGKTLYILDEPTTGLHFADIHKLLDVLNALVETGNTVLVIEHNLDVIKSADYVIDLGPEGGDGGGQIIAAGTPEELTRVKESYTGKYLKDVL